MEPFVFRYRSGELVSNDIDFIRSAISKYYSRGRSYISRVHSLINGDILLFPLSPLSDAILFHRILQCLPGNKLGHHSRFDIDLLASLWIPALSGLPFAYLKAAEP